MQTSENTPSTTSVNKGKMKGSEISRSDPLLRSASGVSPRS
jgi:hypothetical protein